MTVFAGAISMRQDGRIPDELCAELSELISRDPDAEVREYRSPAYFIAHVDVGAFGATGRFVAKDGALTLLVGDPVLDCDIASAPSRDVSARLLHQAWCRSDDELLRKARAAYCAIHLDATGSRAALVTDKLALRPLFCWLGEPFLVFATALRVLEHCAVIPKVLNLRALAEMARFGYALSDRTAYQHIIRLKAGEILRIEGGNIRRTSYWRWDRKPTARLPRAELESEAFRIFDKAIRLRLGNDRTTLAFLSGGLDSRCNVAILRSLGATVYSFDFSLPESQDAFFASLFAQAAGSIHQSYVIEEPQGYRLERFSFGMAAAAAALTRRLGDLKLPDRPSLAWSGEHGSFTVGFISLGRKLFELARSSDSEAAIEEYVRASGNAISRRMMKAPLARLMANTPYRAVREELARIDCDDPAQRFYILHLVSGSSRFMTRHFESIDLHKLETLTPFCDTQLIEHMITVPMDLGIGHKFYHDWIKLFPPCTTAVPWQTYPGHEPCWLPMPEGLPTQWELDTRTFKKKMRKELLREGFRMMVSKNWPNRLLNRYVFAIYILAYWLRLGDYNYIVRLAKLFFDHSVIAQGHQPLTAFDDNPESDSAAA